MPLAPVCRPKDIPEDHEVDIWVFLYTINFKQTYNDWRNVAMTDSTKLSSDDSNSDYYHEIAKDVDGIEYYDRFLKDLELIQKLN